MRGGGGRSRASVGAARWTGWARRAVERGAARPATQPAGAQASGVEWAAARASVPTRSVRGSGPVGGGSAGPYAGWGSWEPRPGMHGAGPRGGGGAGPRGCVGERGRRALGHSRPSRRGCGAGPAEFEWAAGRPREGKRARGGLGRGVGPWWAEEGFFSFCFSSFSISSLFYFPTIKFIYNK
jgi:hypothetical protein